MKWIHGTGRRTRGGLAIQGPACCLAAIQHVEGFFDHIIHVPIKSGPGTVVGAGDDLILDLRASSA
jgi:hypothetical protein